MHWAFLNLISDKCLIHMHVTLTAIFKVGWLHLKYYITIKYKEKKLMLSPT